MEYERLVDDGTVPYYTGLKEPKDFYDDDIERQLDKLMKLKAEYITQAQRLENVSGIKVLDVDENIYIGFKKGFADRYIKSEMERLAKQFNSTLFITPDYKSGISKAFFQVQKNFTLINIITAKEAE